MSGIIIIAALVALAIFAGGLDPYNGWSWRYNIFNIYGWFRDDSDDEPGMWA